MNRRKQLKCFRPALRIYLIAAFTLTILLALSGAANAQSQWTTNGNNINNTNTGNVGVGTTTPNEKLTVSTTGNTDFRIRSSGPNNPYGLFRLQGVGSTPYFQILVGDDLAYRNLVLNDYGGNVGIGTANPLYGKLQVNKTIRIDDDSGSVTGSDTLGAAPGLYIGTSGGGDYFQYNAGGGLDLWQYNAGWTRRVTFAKTGDVGIGTTAPAYRLDVQGGQVNASGGLCIAGDCKTSWSQVGGGGASQWTTSGTNIYYNSGGVGIGTTAPDSSLHVAGGSFYAFPKPGQVSWTSAVFSNNYDATLRILHGGGASTIYTDSASQAVNFSTNGSGNSRLYISGGGNVGIGTTAPANKLTVIGDGAGIAQIGTIGCGGNYVGITLPLLVAPGGCTNYTFASSPTDQTLYINRPSGNSIRFRENNGYSPDQLVIASGGNVGIGTTNPTARLDVNGDTNVAGNINVTGNIAAKYQDVAEWVPATHALPAGTVVVLNPTKSNQVMASAKSYDTRVAGVISERPGLTLGEAGQDKVLVATTGRVRVKVDATRAPITVGDLLVTSDKEGVAMKSEPLDLGGTPIHRPGTLIGKALEPLDKGVGEILVLLSLQ